MLEAQEEPQALLNFLYRDEFLASSFYAQIFTGLLREFHKEDKKVYSKETTLNGGIKAVAEIKSQATSRERGETTVKEVLEPHDTMYLELLNSLIPYLSEDLANAQHGDLVKINGQLLILGQNILKVGLEAFLMLLKHNPKAFGLAKQNKKDIKLLEKFLDTLISSPQLSSRYILFSTHGTVVGYLQEKFLTEPLEGLTFKYGYRAIPNIILIGIKENPSNYSHKFSPETVEGAIYEIAKAFASFLPQGDYLVKPLFIYYPTYLASSIT